MKTHTIRWNKSKTARIVCLTNETLQLLKDYHIDAVRLVLNGLLKYLNSLNGKNHVIDMDSESFLLQHWGDKFKKIELVESELNLYPLRKWITDGYKFKDMLSDVKILDYFYNKILV